MSSLALGYVVNLLARREYSEYEIRCKMQEKAFTELEIEQVIAHCQQKNWQSDRRFAENYLRFRAQKGFGINRIKQELRQLKGISVELIQETIEQSEIDWAEIALQVLHKKFPYFQEQQDVKNKQKIWRYMLSHGFYSEDFSDYLGSYNKY
ncbi:recombination regulator RecX [Pasteurellaceae bacterium Pebbles2]|nr:recombination regulator RecX [Pasteurellaceae bacterium Pebbles2]